MYRIGVIGYGYWGPNIVRNFSNLAEATVTRVCDLNLEAQKRVKTSYPNIGVGSDANDILSSPDIDVVAVATPVSTHFELAKKALTNGKHVFVEKPFTRTATEAQELIQLADKNNLTLMVDHTFLFTSSVRKIKQLVDEGTLGKLYYYDSMRVNLGLFQHDVNVIWDLAPHDLSIMDFLIENKPIGISANGGSHFGNGLQNIAYITIYFPNDVIAHLNVNWLSPVKVRTTLIGGEKKMLVWNDLEADEKIKIYDRGVELKNGEGVSDLLVSYRAGDMWAPRLDHIEALKMEAEYFIDCIANGVAPINDGYAGLRVVKMLEACSESLKNKGIIIDL